MHRILVVEDEETLRAGMVRALAKLPGVEVVGAGTLSEAIEHIDAHPPDAVFSDLDLPDRNGAELLGELEHRRIRIPVTFVSAYTRQLGARIPRSPNVRLVDKPVSLERLRELARAALAARDSELPPPFGAADYLQIACLGRHSVVITHRAHEDDELADARIVIWKGNLWSASDEKGEGPDAFRRIVTRAGSFRAHTLDRDPGPRQLEGPWEHMLLDALRMADEAALERDDEPSGLTVVAAQVPSYDDAVDRGLAALLTRDYITARIAFEEALRARPDDAMARANLERLAALGIKGSEGSGGTA